MKRPEGFDQHPPRTPEVPATPNAGRPSAPRKPRRERAGRATKSAPELAPAASAKPATKPARTPRSRPAERSEPKPTAPARSEARKAARLRRRYERGEVRRFTRRSRHRRAGWLSAAGALVVLCLLVTVAVYSPLLALKTLKIEGASSVSAAEIRSALAGQIGTPLALVDFDKIKTDLGKFPLIRSYVTETVPPNTLIIHIVERTPLGVIARAGGYTVVDAAGVTLSHATERPPKLPIIDSGSSTTTSTAFKAAVSVLLALPASVSSKVDTISARTKDDVTLVLDGVGQRVVWGSAERSAVKARVLADLISHQNANSVVEYDVSAPNSAVVRSG